MAFFKQCLLPTAVTTRQRAFCRLAGGIVAGVALGGTTYMLYKNEPIIWKTMNHKVLPVMNDALKNSSLNDPLEKSPLNPIVYGGYTDQKKLGINALLCSFYAYTTIGLLGVMYGKHKKTMERVNGTTKCCNIIRHTMWYCTIMPVLALGTTAFALEFWHKGSNTIYHAKKIIEKSSTKE